MAIRLVEGVRLDGDLIRPIDGEMLVPRADWDGIRQFLVRFHRETPFMNFRPEQLDVGGPFIDRRTAAQLGYILIQHGMAQNRMYAPGGYRVPPRWQVRVGGFMCWALDGLFVQ